jgi:hypothetical protein
MSGRRVVIVMLIGALLFVAALSGAYWFWGADRLGRMPRLMAPHAKSHTGAMNPAK